MDKRKLFIAILAGVLAAVIILGIVAMVVPAPVSAASSSEIKEQIKDLEREQTKLKAELKELEKKKKENLSEIKDIVDQKSVIEQQASLLFEQVELVNSQIASYAVLIADKQAEVDQAQSKLEALKKKHKERIRAMEENGKLSYWLVLFEATSFTDLLDRMTMIQEIAASDNRRLQEMAKAAEEVEAAKNALEAERKALEENKAELVTLQAEMEAKHKEADALLQALLEKGEEFDDYMSEAEDKMDELDDELDKAEKELSEAERKEYLEYISTMPSNGGGQSSIDGNGIRWVVPCKYRKLTSPFGYRIHPVYKKWKMHNGVDLANSCPTPIWAARSGVVIDAGYDDSSGYHVQIDHLDGFVTMYKHFCKKPSVKVGDIVIAGDVIGCMGTTGVSTGVHLHFGVKYKGEWVNPMDYIGN